MCVAVGLWCILSLAGLHPPPNVSCTPVCLPGLRLCVLVGPQVFGEYALLLVGAGRQEEALAMMKLGTRLVDRCFQFYDPALQSAIRRYWPGVQSRLV